MTVLITGGTGFIGRALAAALLADGEAVRVWTRNPERARQLLGEEVVCSRDLATLLPVDAVVNLAGENLAGGRWTARRKQAFRDSRIGLTRELVSAFAEHGAPQVLVSGSAVGYYGAQNESQNESQDDAKLTEESSAGDEFQSELCRDWEMAARQAETQGVRVCLLRTGIVLGLDQHKGGALKPMLLPFRLGLGSWLGHGSQWMSWIHRDDLVALIRLMIHDPAMQGAFNGTAPAPVINKHFAKALGAALHRPVFYGVPAPVLRLLLGEMAHLLLTGQRVVPQAAQASGFRFQYPDIESAFADLLR